MNLEMERKRLIRQKVLAATLLTLFLLPNQGVVAQTGDEPTVDSPSFEFDFGLTNSPSFMLGARQEDANGDVDAAIDAGDKTGTNPINFTFDLRLYNEYQWLNTTGDGNNNITTLEFRIPFADGNWQFRVRARANSIGADLNGNGMDDLDDSGFGDLDFRFLTVPYLDMSKKMAVAAGLEVVLDTASEDALGSGSTILGPQVFLVLFKPFGSDLDLFAPAYQHQFSVDGNDVNRSLIDLFFLKTSVDKTMWGLFDPQFVIDHEADTEFILIDIEIGTMLDKYLGTKGHSAYIRPSFGIGSDRPYEASIEVGYKIVW